MVTFFLQQQKQDEQICKVLLECVYGGFSECKQAFPVFYDLSVFRWLVLTSFHEFSVF